MATYGKKRKLILPPLSAFRDSDSEPIPNTKEHRPIHRASNANLPMAHSQGNGSQLSRRDSIEEMANMLLDDTTAYGSEADPDLSEELSEISLTMGASTTMTQAAPANRNNIPHSAATLASNNDWPLPVKPLTIGAGPSSDMIQESTPSDQFSGTSQSISTRPIRHARKFPASSMNRKALRQKPLARRGSISHQETISHQKSISRPSYATSSQSDAPSPLDPAPIHDSIQSMLAATKALKPANDETVPRGPMARTKKSFRDGQVLVKMKSAMRNYIHPRPSLSKASISSPIPLEVGLGEDNNIEDESVPQIASHRTVRCDLLTGDPRPLGSRVSTTDPSSQGCPPSGQHGTPRLHQTLTDPTQLKEPKFNSMGYQVDYDATFSSSPMAQSTPRIQLYPTIEEGEKSQDDTAVDSKRLSTSENCQVAGHSDMDIDVDSMSILSSSTMGSQLGVEVRTKKHPSPSKSYLEDLQELFRREYPECVDDEDSLSRTPSIQLSTVPVLATKDPNEGTIVSKGLKKVKSFGFLKRSNRIRTTKSTADVNEGPQSRGLFPAPRLGNPFYSSHGKREHVLPTDQQPATQTSPMADSVMDIDELQLNDPAYNIATKP